MQPNFEDHSARYEIDHIVAQNLFENVDNDNSILKMKDCFLNYALLPKGDNIAKNDKKLNLIKIDDDQLLADQIKKYAEISDSDMDTLSDLKNIEKLKNIWLPLFIDAFDSKRDDWLLN